MTLYEQRNDQQRMHEFAADVLHGEGWTASGSSPARRKAASQIDIELVGRSHAFLEAMKQVDRISTTNLPVLLTGEAGTGKELVALAIHQRSGRGDRPFVTVNCGAISAESIEDELFVQADGGTLFLSQITGATPSLQMKLLSVLQSGEIRRAGANQTQKVNVRVIAASNRNLEQEVAAGRFRDDLFSRFNSGLIGLPPLRQRPEDIAPLAQSFAERVYSLNPAVTFSPEALAMLEHYVWPGNIRELENVVVRAVANCDGTVRVTDLPEAVRNHSQNQAAPENTQTETANGAASEEWVPLSEIEGRYVAQVLEHTRGNKQAAARVLAIDRKTLDRMIKRHHIDSEKARRIPRQ